MIFVFRPKIRSIEVKTEILWFDSESENEI